MGQVYAEFRLVNPFTKQSVSIHALVDTGAWGTYVTRDIARQLGFDPQEASVQYLTMADERQVPAPHLGPVSIYFEDRRCSTDIMVLGKQCLVGAIPLEQLRLIVDPLRQKLIRDPSPRLEYVLPVRFTD